MGQFVRRLDAGRLVLGRRELGVGLLDPGGRLRELVLHLGDVERGENLAAAHAIANVHPHLSDVTGELRHDVHFLERLELGSQRDVGGEIASFNRGDPHCRKVGGRFCRLRRRARAAGDRHR